MNLRSKGMWAAALLALAACKSNGSNDQTIPEDLPSDPDSGHESSWRNPPPESPAGSSSAVGAPAATRTHVVKKGDTLFSLAREYYNDQAQWRKILEANRASINNKDQIKVGQELTIPD